MVSALIDTNIPQLKLLSKGKVRDIYATSSLEHLLFVASDRISAYDVILKNGIPDKGQVLTELSLFWFDKLKDIHPEPCRDVSDRMRCPKEVHQHREQKAEVVPLEAIVRGYITGSAWAEYKKSRTVHGIPLPAPLFTPSTKAEQGAHDENISPEQAAALIGQELYDKISAAAPTRGLIVADTKFEFGLIDGELILIDEALTPDSSRYWPLEGYAPGRSQPSFDKQYLRDWLTSQGFRKGLEGGPDGEGWTMSEEVVRETREKVPERERLAAE
ncbi:phosphoribosylaminoimidazole-succinocarboxamide synthase [Lactarius indigo]|nr:phosphoribosylaminoimidazole-succinocarboxamide synthase [Lactarius indigo]